jgi:hypothetical protein
MKIISSHGIVSQIHPSFFVESCQHVNDCKGFLGRALKTPHREVGALRNPISAHLRRPSFVEMKCRSVGVGRCKRWPAMHVRKSEAAIWVLHWATLNQLDGVGPGPFAKNSRKVATPPNPASCDFHSLTNHPNPNVELCHYQLPPNTCITS